MIASGKDGVGKSTVTALAGEALAAMGRSVLLLELENGLRCLDTFVDAGGVTIFDLADVMSGQCEPQSAIVKSRLSDRLSVLYAAFHRTDSESELFPGLILSLAEQYDHILVDTDCSDQTLDAVSRIAMHNVVVATPDPMGLRDARYVCERLYARSAPGVRLLLNRVDAQLIYRGMVPHLDYCIDVVGAQLVGVIPQLPEIAFCTAEGRLPQEGSLAATISHNIASRLDGVHVPLAVR